MNSRQKSLWKKWLQHYYVIHLVFISHNPIFNVQWHLNYLLCQNKETQEACKTVWTEHISACRLSQLRVCSVSYTCKILLCLLCISLDSWGSSRAFAQSLALFFPRFTGIKIRDCFSLGHSFKENKRLIGLMMNYSVLFKTAFCLYYSYTVSELSQRWALRVTLAFWGDDCNFHLNNIVASQR